MLAVAATINFAMLGVLALRIVFLVRTEGAAAGTLGALISLGGLGGLGSLGGLLGAGRLAGSQPLRQRTNLPDGQPRDRAVHAAAPGWRLAAGGWRLALFAAGSFVVMAASAMSSVITVTFQSNYIPV